ncbi:MAG: ISNCY family transposase [Planctomycetota bacterium]|nr:ISNCY family transposase [Planctomycetota bacterium]
MQLTMSAKERDRLQVVGQVERGQVTQRKAGELLGISERQVRRSVRRHEAEGDAGLVHRARGRSSNRRLGATLQERAVAALRERYPDFGPTLAAEKLAAHEGIAVSRETVRGWMIAAGLWEPRRSKVKHRRWRPRRSCLGELVQMDTSEHAWFEGRAEREPVLINMIDDATGRVFMRFFDSDSTQTNMTLLRDYIRRHGRPQAIYADKDSIFRVNRSPTIAEQLAGREAETQFGRALRELDITYIAAHSPQAKGRVERSFGTLQDRLVKELRLRGISTIAAANAYLKREFIPDYNRRFAVKPASAANAHRPAKGHDLDAILSHQETRVVLNDYTIGYDHVRYQIGPSGVVAGLRGGKVTVQLRLDGTMRLQFRGQYLAFAPVPTRPAPEEAAVPRRRRAPEATRQPYRPPPDHPWRESFRRWFRRPAAGAG